MRRLLVAIVTTGLLLGLASPAFAGGRVPAGVKRISVALTFPLEGNGTYKAVHRTLTKTTAVRKVVGALDALRAATVHGVCPMFMRLGPELTVIYRGSSGQMLAETKVLVALGSTGGSGSSYCFPITFTGGGQSQRLVGNSYVRMIGRMIGTPIS